MSLTGQAMSFAKQLAERDEEIARLREQADGWKQTANHNANHAAAVEAERDALRAQLATARETALREGARAIRAVGDKLVEFADSFDLHDPKKRDFRNRAAEWFAAERMVLGLLAAPAPTGGNEGGGTDG